MLGLPATLTANQMVNHLVNHWLSVCNGPIVVTVGCRPSAGQGQFAGQRPAFCKLCNVYLSLYVYVCTYMYVSIGIAASVAEKIYLFARCSSFQGTCSCYSRPGPPTWCWSVRHRCIAVKAITLTSSTNDTRDR